MVHSRVLHSKDRHLLLVLLQTPLQARKAYLRPHHHQHLHLLYLKLRTSPQPNSI